MDYIKCGICERNEARRHGWTFCAACAEREGARITLTGIGISEIMTRLRKLEGLTKAIDWNEMPIKRAQASASKEPDPPVCKSCGHVVVEPNEHLENKCPNCAEWLHHDPGSFTTDHRQYRKHDGLADAIKELEESIESQRPGLNPNPLEVLDTGKTLEWLCELANFREKSERDESIKAELEKASKRIDELQRNYSKLSQEADQRNRDLLEAHRKLHAWRNSPRMQISAIGHKHDGVWAKVPEGEL